MNYQWQIGPADVTDTSTLKDVVTQIHWSCVGTASNGSTFKSSGSVSMGAPDPTTFIPFNKLTRSEIEGIVYSKIDAKAIESNLAKEYDLSTNPPVKPFNF